MTTEEVFIDEHNTVWRTMTSTYHPTNPRRRLLVQKSSDGRTRTIGADQANRERTRLDEIPDDKSPRALWLWIDDAPNFIERRKRKEQALPFLERDGGDGRYVGYDC